MSEGSEIMQIESIKFSNYKAFKNEQLLKIKPITIIIGKNNSGKSVVSRLPILINHSFTKSASEPLDLLIKDIDFGYNFKDLVYNDNYITPIDIEVVFRNKNQEKILITNSIRYIPEKDRQVVERGSIEYNEKTIQYIWNLDKENEQEYIINKNKKKKLVFNGLLPDIKDFQEIIASIQDRSSIHYIAPIRKEAKREYRYDPKKINDIDSSGEGIPSFLYHNYLKGDKKIIEMVSDWYKQNFNYKLTIDSPYNIEGHIETSRIFNIVLFRNEIKKRINLVDAGQGISQFLPIVTLGKMSEIYGSLTILEQPELHLHPGIHPSIADLMVDLIYSKNSSAKFLVETHSENLILRLRRRIAEKKLNNEDVIIYWVDDEVENKSLKEIKINKFGEIESEWPEGIFSEDFEEAKAIRTAQEKYNAGNN